MQVENYRRKTGRVMLEDGDMMTITQDLFHAPFALFYHNNFEAPERPLYQYANQVLCAAPGCGRVCCVFGCELQCARGVLGISHNQPAETGRLAAAALLHQHGHQCFALRLVSPSLDRCGGIMHCP